MHEARRRDALARLLARPIAHRGLHACGAPGAVENSIGAAEGACAAGYGIECDVQLSLDGEAMVFHDDDLARLTGVAARIDAVAAEALGRLRLRGGPDIVPTLDRFLAAIAGRVPVVIEIKKQSPGDMRLADRVLAIVETYPGPAALESFDPAVVAHCFRQRSPRPVGLVGPLEGGEAEEGVIPPCDFLSWSIESLDEVSRRHPTLPRTTWTVRTQAQEAHAASRNAQIVFEGFTPQAMIHPDP